MKLKSHAISFFLYSQKRICCECIFRSAMTSYKAFRPGQFFKRRQKESDYKECADYAEYAEIAEYAEYAEYAE